MKWYHSHWKWLAVVVVAVATLWPRLVDQSGRTVHCDAGDAHDDDQVETSVVMAMAMVDVVQGVTMMMTMRLLHLTTSVESTWTTSFGWRRRGRQRQRRSRIVTS